MQEMQALVQQGKVPAMYITAAVATARSLRDDFVKAQGTVIAPPIDHTVVSGSISTWPNIRSVNLKVYLSQSQSVSSGH